LAPFDFAGLFDLSPIMHLAMKSQHPLAAKPMKTDADWFY
jgi:hypothetical protein